jgi:predicted nucleic acid-binding protein
VIGPDASFLVALYLPGDKFTPLARVIAAEFEETIAYLPLTELEVTNVIRRSCGEDRISRALMTRVLREIEADINARFLHRCSVNASAYYDKALELSKAYATELRLRALDILHVAAAELLGVSAFVSFDIRQRKLVKTIGLKLLPETL